MAVILPWLQCVNKTDKTQRTFWTLLLNASIQFYFREPHWKFNGASGNIEGNLDKKKYYPCHFFHSRGTRQRHSHSRHWMAWHHGYNGEGRPLYQCSPHESTSSACTGNRMPNSNSECHPGSLAVCTPRLSRDIMPGCRNFVLWGKLYFIECVSFFLTPQLETYIYFYM